MAMKEQEVKDAFNKASALKALWAELSDDGCSWKIKTTCGQFAIAYEPGKWAGQPEFDFEVLG